MATVAAAPPSWRAWVAAARPRTLWAGAAPVAVGTAVAAAEGGARSGPALAALAGALLLQVASNLANDVYDHERGADGASRVGPPRATQMGWLAAAQVKRATWGVLAVAAGVGLYLVAVGGWPIGAIGSLAMLAAFAYTGGPWPLGYHGLGDVLVFAFFGVAAVAGTAYVQTGAWTAGAFAASVPVGALATAILVVNNLRDVETDAAVGKRTLAVRLGERATRLEYRGLLAVAYGAVPVAWLAGAAPAGALVAWASAPLAGRLWRGVGRARGADLDPLLGATARLLAVHAGLLALGWAA